MTQELKRNFQSVVSGSIQALNEITQGLAQRFPAENAADSFECKVAHCVNGILGNILLMDGKRLPLLRMSLDSYIDRLEAMEGQVPEAHGAFNGHSKSA